MMRNSFGTCGNFVSAAEPVSQLHQQRPRDSYLYFHYTLLAERLSSLEIRA